MGKPLQSATPPEELARRVLKLHKATLPVDVFAIAANYAELHFESLPKTIDGLAVHKTRNEVPKIIVNKTSAKTRQRFTVAHELGHILIPWHSGISVDAFEIALAGDEPVGSDDETEANRFAAELLLPAQYVLAALRNNSIGQAILELRSAATTSIAVACLAIIANSPKTHLVVIVNGTSKVVGSYKTTGAWISRPSVGTTLLNPQSVFSLFQPEIQIARASPYEDAQTLYVWTIDSDRLWKLARRGGDWRSTLVTIMQERSMNSEDKRAIRESFAGMSGFANNLVQRGSLSLKKRFELLVQRAISNETVARISNHELFPTLLAQRARSLKPRRKLPVVSKGTRGS